MKYSPDFFKTISQHSNEFENLEDLEDLDLVISRTSYLSNQNDNNEIDAQHDDDSFSHVDLFKAFNKIHEELKCQCLIIQNLNASLVTLEYRDLKLAFQQFSHESKVKLFDIFEEKVFEYNIFIFQYFFIFHIYLIIYNNKKNKNKILFIIFYFNDILKK